MIKNFLPLMLIIISIIIFIIALKKGSRSRVEILAYYGLISKSLKTIRNNFWPCPVLIFLPFLDYSMPVQNSQLEPPPALTISYFEGFTETAWHLIKFPFEISFLASLLLLPIFFYFFWVKYSVVLGYTDTQNHKRLNVIRYYSFLLFLILLGAFGSLLYISTDYLNFLKITHENQRAQFSGSSSMTGFFLYVSAFLAIIPFSTLTVVAFYSLLTKWGDGKFTKKMMGQIWNIVLLRFPIFLKFSLLVLTTLMIPHIIGFLSVFMQELDMSSVILDYYWITMIALLPICFISPFFFINEGNGLFNSFKLSLALIKANPIKSLLVILIPVLILTLLSIGVLVIEYYYISDSIIYKGLDILFSIVWNLLSVIFYLTATQLYLKHKVSST